MVFTAASRSAAVRSASFALAMSSSCLRVTLPTFSVFGRFEPDWMPAAFFIITAYSDRTFTFVTKSTPASVLLKKAAGIQSGSKGPNTDKVGKVTRAQLEDIAKAKEADLTAAELEAAVRTIAGSARSMGLVVEG